MADIRVVAELSETECDRKAAADDLEDPFKELAANLLRTIRGNGSPEHLLRQMQLVINAAVAFRKTFGHYPEPSRIHAILRVENFRETMTARLQDRICTQVDIERWERDGSFELGDAEHQICRGVLQIFASKLAGQLPQERVGKREMQEGIRALTKVRTKRRLQA